MPGFDVFQGVARRVQHSHGWIFVVADLSAFALLSDLSVPQKPKSSKKNCFLGGIRGRLAG
jgi:hypothetical protein